MALLWTDGLDRYGAYADLKSNGGYYAVSNFGSFQATGGKTGGGALRHTGSGTTKKIFATAGTIAAGNGVHWCAWFRVNSIDAQQIVAFGTNIVASDLTNPPKLLLNTDGSLSVTTHNAATTLATSAVGVVTAATYVHIEYAAKYNTSGLGGYIKVWVNGNIAINFSGTTQSGTVPSTYTDFQVGMSINSGKNHDWDDFICWDENGTDFALTQLTTAYLPVIETLSIDANDAVQFTPSTGSNFQNVDDPAFQNSDTDYNSSSTVGHVDLFTLANQAATPLYTFGMVVKTVAKIDIAGTINLRTRLVSGATTTDSADRLLTTAYVLYADYFGKDPATTAAWTTTQVNNLKSGYKYQS